MRIAIGNDHAGFDLKNAIKDYLQELGMECKDFGAYSTKPCDDYAYIAAEVGEAVASGVYDRGILICGTGIGMSIAANKVPGVRAALCNDLFSTKKSREHNNANILTVGSRIVGVELAKEIVKIWLTTEFMKGRHTLRVDKYSEIEKRCRLPHRSGYQRKWRNGESLMIQLKKAIDLSHTLLPGEEEYRLEVKNKFVEEFLPEYHRSEGEWYIMSEVIMWSHVGTHLEAPFHCLRDGTDVSEIPLSRLMGEAIVLDFSHKKTNEPIERKELEEVGKDVKENDIIIIKTGLDRFYRTPKAHDRPYLSLEAVKWLVEKKIACLATDASGFEIRGINAQPNHRLLFQSDIPVIEHLTNLDRLTQKRFFLIALPWKVKGLDASPVRVIGVEE